MGTIALQSPTIGQPNSTEDPKITSDFTVLQTLLNGNVDTNNLSATAGITAGQLAAGAGYFALAGPSSGGGSLAPNYFYALSGGATPYTLPSVTANTRVGVWAYFVSGTSPVTINATGGALIYGKGANGVSGIVLGAEGANVTLLANGTSWFIIAGEQDTGWLAITGVGGIVQAFSGGWGTPYTAGARLKGDLAMLRGGLGNSSGSSIGAGGVMAHVPTVCFPASTVFPTLGIVEFGAGLSAPSAGQITTAGGIATEGSNVPNNWCVMLDGITYPVN